MNPELIREMLLRRPFEPFVIHLSGGESYEIRHPEVVAVGKARLVIIDPHTDQMTVCALLHVTSVQTLQSA